MQEIHRYTAKQLAEVLEQYGDMFVAVAIVGGTHDQQSTPLLDLRPEITVTEPGGDRVVCLVGYDFEPDGTSDDEEGDDER